jgi:hypothetical protein
MAFVQFARGSPPYGVGLGRSSANQASVACVEIVMKSAALHFVALASALVLALPPGWCGQLTAAGHEAEPAPITCCHGQAAPTDSQLPAPAASECCCSQPAVMAEKMASSSNHQHSSPIDQALPVALSDAGQATVGSTFSEPVSPQSAAGLRLHALLGVWRC